MDILLLAFGALQIALFLPYESPTNTLRRIFLFFIDIYLLYFVLSRSCASRKLIAEAMSAFCLSCVVMAPLAIFESLRHWWLYTDIELRWASDQNVISYFLRGGMLRAQASAGHAISLGVLLALACGCWLYLKTKVSSRPTRIAVTIFLWVGLFVTYARGPWLGAILIYFALAALGPRALPRLIKAFGIAAILTFALGVSPLGERIWDLIPFLGGSADSASYVYRQRLAERSWALIKENPFFGDQFVLTRMEDLRQGEGIIDLINTYATVALYDGIVGLVMFSGFILVALISAYSFARKVARSDPDLSLMGFSLVACILGILLMLSATSFIQGPQKMFFCLAALATAYACLGRVPTPSPGTRSRRKQIMGRG
jgi:O-antigen ligase